MSKVYPNAYTVDEENSHRFYQMPKELFISERYKDLSSNAKVLYSVLLDRKELSRKNKWYDKYNQIYLMFTRENLSLLIGVSVRTVQRAFKELSERNLIIEQQQGLNKPNRIYVCRVESHEAQGHANLAHQDRKDWHASDTDLRETEKIKRYTVSLGNSDCEFLSYYNQTFKEYKGKDHPLMTEEQYDYVETKLNGLKDNNSIMDNEVYEFIDRHFEELSPNNDGKIYAFLDGKGADGVMGKMVRGC